ncbi:MAG: AAA family ATPase [Myxococcales bacterium]|nr:AAA family ATPase [Myxococcales bacterium]
MSEIGKHPATQPSGTRAPSHGTDDQVRADAVAGADADPEMQTIVSDEERVLARVLKNLENRKRRSRNGIDYDAELIALRDQIGEARLEDVPALVAQMERLQQVAARRADVVDENIDPTSPYFGRIVLEEGDRRRQVLIGRATYLDSKTGVQIVDWRDAPVSRVYYRYEEGDDYDEVFGGRPVEGEVLVRRSLSIAGAALKRIGCPQGTFIRRRSGHWVRAGESATQLAGGQGLAPRPSHYQPVGRLGIEHDDAGREEKYLPEIASLIDRRQFELITLAESGLVVIQGGAGSGKTTIGLHRMAYLAFQSPKRFRADRMQVIVFNDALARYISHVLPALGVPGVPVTTFHAWARKLRISHLPQLPRAYTDETPDVVVRLKKHPAWLAIIEERMAELERDVLASVQRLCEGQSASEALMAAWKGTSRKALSQRLGRLMRWASDSKNGVPVALRHALERETSRLRAKLDPVHLWADMLTDRGALEQAFERHAPGDFTSGQIGQAFRWCAARCNAVLAALEERDEGELDRRERAELETNVGIDGSEESGEVVLDWEDDALLLRLWQQARGPLRRNKEPLRYEHMFVDEAQDLSPLELSVVLGTVASESVTLAGDVAQRLYMDNGFSDWDSVLGRLGFAHIEIEPLRISYRSTRQIMDFANDLLGPLRPARPGEANRDGVPVELFQFAHTGDAVGFLSESLRALAGAEPLASVAVIARTPEQAAEYAAGLTRAEVPNVRLIADQDFPFRAGVDVTDVRQVKGLEFDYVVLVEASAASYPIKDEARHLMHIAATRAAHQLWVLASDRPSPLLPQELVNRGY